MKNTMRQTIVLMFLLVPFLGGCPTETSDNVRQTWISTDYDLLFDATDNTVIGKAQFTSWTKDDDGWTTTTYIQLTDHSEVFFNNLPMTLVEPTFKQLYYKKILSHQDSNTEHQWRYVQNDGAVFNNSAKAVDAPLFEVAGTEISKRGFTLSWHTLMPIGRDKLILTYRGFNDHFEDSVTLEDLAFEAGVTSGEISVAATSLQHFEVGRVYQFQLCREQIKTDLLQPANSSGTITIRSCAPSKKLTVGN